MNTKEAKEIIADFEKLRNRYPGKLFTGKTIQAESYLEAIEKASVFERLEKEFRSCKRHKAGDGLCCQCSDAFFDALAKWEAEK